MRVYYGTKPVNLLYMPLPNGTADVWIRKDIQENEDGWQAEEIYFRTNQSFEEVSNNLNYIFFSKFNIEGELVSVIQKYLDDTVKQRGYDNIVSACSYSNSTDEIFKNEAEACIRWRDTVWRTCYNILDNVKAGNEKIPTAEELISRLPTLEW